MAYICCYKHVKIMVKTIENSVERYQQIIEWIPVIKQIISLGGEWEQLKGICEPLGLSDTSFREYPRENDYLLNVDYWKGKIVAQQ